MRPHLLFAVLLLALSPPAPAQHPIKTSSGKLSGVPTLDGKVLAFKGIPYAAPPVGNLRWQPPQPAARWKGVRAAADFGSHCIQSATYNDMHFRDPGPSEDCLTLNVWAPANAKHLPVMIWIYGGGFTAGSTSEPRQDGQFLAHRDVIVVSMNYRMGIFGFFAHPALTAESPHHASGNYGLLDIAAAIAWTHQNIARFGGDPRNLTVFGESAGSFGVSTMMASPLTRGLLSKAIGESGAAFSSNSLTYEPRATVEPGFVAFAQSALHATTLADLRRIPADDLLKAAIDRTITHPRFGPDIDGYLLPTSVPAIFAAGQQAHIPLLAGWNLNERGNPNLSPEAFTAEATKDFGPAADKFLALYPAATPEQAATSSRDYEAHKFIAYSTWAWLEAHSQTGAAPIFRYRLDLGSPGDKYHKASVGAFHSDDIEYVFGTLDSRIDFTARPEDRQLSEQMGTWWTNFARTGNPNPSPTSLPVWPAYKPSDWQVMHLDATPHPEPDPARPQLLFLQSIWSKPTP